MPERSPVRADRYHRSYGRNRCDGSYRRDWRDRRPRDKSDDPGDDSGNRVETDRRDRHFRNGPRTDDATNDDPRNFAETLTRQGRFYFASVRRKLQAPLVGGASESVILEADA